MGGSAPFFRNSPAGRPGSFLRFPPLTLSPLNTLPAGKEQDTLRSEPAGNQVLGNSQERMSKTMNIGIDHGYYAIKTRHFSFPAGITAYSHEPYIQSSKKSFIHSSESKSPEGEVTRTLLISLKVISHDPLA